jgi:hypothetical protein
MIKRFLVAFILFIVCCRTDAQDLSLYTGLSYSLMEDMKDLQRLVANELPVRPKYVQEFPPYWQYGLSMRWGVTEKYKLGFYVFTTSTGGRATYEDYSGEFTFDQTLRCFGLTIHNEYVVHEGERSAVLLYLETGYIATWLDLDYFLRIGDSSESFTEEFHSSNYLFEGGVQYQYFLKPKLFLEGRFGFQGNMANDLISDEDDYETDLKADWSGVKLLVGIGFRLSK